MSISYATLVAATWSTPSRPDAWPRRAPAYRMAISEGSRNVTTSAGPMDEWTKGQAERRPDLRGQRTKDVEVARTRPPFVVRAESTEDPVDRLPGVIEDALVCRR